MDTTFYHTLPNGVQIVQRAVPSQVVYIGIMVGAGTRHETAAENGMAHYIEHCVFKGTEHYTARQIISHIEGTGGEINAYTTKEETVFYAATLRRHWRVTLRMLADMVLHPAFPKRETDKEMSVILDEIESYNDSPGELIYDDFEGQIFKGHPLAMPVLGTRKTLRAIGASAARPLAWMQAHYLPERMVLFVSGNIPPQQVVAYAGRELGALASVAMPQTVTPPAPLAAPSRVSFRRHTHQTHVMIGARAYALGHSGRLAMFLLNNILGGGSMSSRLNLSLREQRGLVYTVESQYTPLSDTGYWNIYLACEPANKDECVERCLRELQRLREVRLSTSQLSRALQQLEGQMAISAENRENDALSMAKMMLYHHRTESWQETFRRISETTPSLLQDVANELYRESDLCFLQYD